MPSFKLSAAYSILEGDDVELSAAVVGRNGSERSSGSTLHGDYFEGWDPVTKEEWTDNCIDKLLSCQGGNLGDGFILKGAQVPPWGWKTVPERLVPVPSFPTPHKPCAGPLWLRGQVKSDEFGTERPFFAALARLKLPSLVKEATLG